MYCGLKASRRALADAEKAAELFRHGNVDFQLVWVLNVAFLGIIGGVLQKEIRIKILNQDIISTKVWNQHKTPIDNLASIRNKILHHYEQVYEGTDVYVPGVYEDGVYESKQIRREPFKGRDPAAVIGESIKLWEEILDTIEHRLRSRL